MDKIKIQKQDFDLTTEVNKIREDYPGTGAVVSFVGTVRDLGDDEDVTKLYLQHYPGMTEKALAKIVEHARKRWTLDAVTIIHRVGGLDLQDQIVLVAVSSKHRGESFQACEYIMDFLKSRAPFWKKEFYGDKDAKWLDPKPTDEKPEAKWLT